MKMSIVGTVGACLLLPIIGAGAQAQPAPEVRPGNVMPGSLSRFKVEAVSFDAIDETGWFDWPGSDNVYVAIHVPDRKIAILTQVFEGINTGDTKNIPSDQSCILPIAGVTGPTTFSASIGNRWSCSNDGAPGPISFKVWLYNSQKCWFLCWDNGRPLPGAEPVPFASDDALLGSYTVEYSMEKLMALEVGQSKIERSLVTVAGGGGGDNSTYAFNWRLTRLPNAGPVVSPVTR